MESILTAKSALNQVADHYKAKFERGDGRAGALYRTMTELVDFLPSKVTGDDLALYFQLAAHAPQRNRDEKGAAKRRETCKEILAVLESLDAQPGEGSPWAAAAIGRLWWQYSDGRAARYAAMASTFAAEYESAADAAIDDALG